jgi:hypothetical protein
VSIKIAYYWGVLCALPQAFPDQRSASHTRSALSNGLIFPWVRALAVATPHALPRWAWEVPEKRGRAQQNAQARKPFQLMKLKEYTLVYNLSHKAHANAKTGF